MRKAVLAVVAFGLSTHLYAATHAATFIELQEIQDIQFAQLLEHPQSYLNTRVKFRCTYVQEGDIYDQIHTQFSPNRYVNHVVWDDDANIWDPNVRAQPLFSLYVDKVHAADICDKKLHKYDTLDVTGEITSTFDNKPWVNAHKIEVVKSAGRFSENSIYHLEQAVALSVDGTRDIADQHYQAALDENLPNTAKITIGELAAKNQMSAGQYGKSVSYLEDAIDAADRAPAKVKANLHYLKAKALTEMAERETNDDDRKDKFSTSAGEARAALSDDPTLGDAYAVLGISLAGLGNYEEARRQCAQAVRLEPNVAEVRWYLGRILYRQGLFDESIEALKKGIDLTPKDARLHHAIAVTYLARGQKAGANGGSDIGTALREYDIAIRLNPNDLGLYDESAALIEAAIPLKLELPVGTGKKPASYGMAAERYEAALKIDPKHVEAHQGAARCYLADKKTDEANKHLQALLDLDSKNIQRYAALGEILANSGRNQEAVDTYERGLKIDGRNTALLFGIGHLQKSMGEPDKATKHLEAAIKQNSKHVGAHLDLAEIALAAGNKKGALRHAENALDYAKTEDDKVRAKALIQQAKAEAPKPAPAPKAPEKKAEAKPAPKDAKKSATTP